MQEHIRRAHPEHYISKLPATEESFLLMINSPPTQRTPNQQQTSPPGGPGQVATPNSQGRCSPITAVSRPLSSPSRAGNREVGGGELYPSDCVSSRCIYHASLRDGSNRGVGIVVRLILITSLDRHFHAASRKCCSSPSSAPPDRPGMGF